MREPQTGLHFVLPVSFEIKYREPEKNQNNIFVQFWLKTR